MCKKLKSPPTVISNLNAFVKVLLVSEDLFVGLTFGGGGTFHGSEMERKKTNKKTVHW